MTFRKPRFVYLTAFPVLLFLVLFYLPTTTYATYNASNLIDNVIFTNVGSMNQDQIQAFLAGKGSYLANYGSYSGRDGGNVFASRIIAEAALDYGVNPQAIMATLQKEQSLITDPSPSASQLNCAMGYDSCASHNSFYSQVDAGTWQLRYSYEASSGRAWGGHAASEYPCRSASSLYSAGLYPGNTVTFYNPGGSARTITLANAATASLYCYTPYVGPWSETGYSGSYNFVTSFEAWWGSTQTLVPFAWGYEGQWAYSDAARTQPLTDTPTTTPGGTIYLRVKARNLGNQTWYQSFMRLGGSHPMDRVSQFYDSSSWLSNTRPTQMVESSVAPGDVGTFDFTMKAPGTVGTYNEYFNLVADGHTWLNDLGLFFTVNVNNAIGVSNSTDTGLTAGQSISTNDYLLSPDSQSTLAVQRDGNLVLFSNFKPVWATGAVGNAANRLIMQGDGNLVYYNQYGQALWSSQTDGNPGDRLVIQTDGNMVIYSASNVALWATYTLHNPDHLAYVNTALLPGGIMYPGQSLDTADGRFHLILQRDGNLVLYSPTHALWATGTDGKQAAFLIMQGDGNLVLYDRSYRPIWYSRTVGSGQLHMVLQQDGNLVLYNALGVPYWHTVTAGAQ